MLENTKNNEEVNTLKSEHLYEWSRPIIAGVGVHDDFLDEKGDTQEEIYKIFNGRKDDGMIDDVDYYGDHESLTNKNYKNPTANSYVISPINDKDKISRGYKNCTGVVISGIDKETGKNISFLSHQDPGYFLSEENYGFFMDLKQQVAELKEKCVSGTIDAVLFGGNYFFDRTSFKKDYKESIKTLSSGIEKILGFTPPIITGPKMSSGSDNVYFDNENRRLYIVRPKVGESATESYLPKDINQQETKWQAD